MVNPACPGSTAKPWPGRLKAQEPISSAGTPPTATSSAPPSGAPKRTTKASPASALRWPRLNDLMVTAWVTPMW
jgi:hypothetical protein